MSTIETISRRPGFRLFAKYGVDAEDRFEDTGEIRFPRAGEHYIWRDAIVCADRDRNSIASVIVREKAVDHE